jgi:hypothetical protein
MIKSAKNYKIYLQWRRILNQEQAVAAIMIIKSLESFTAILDFYRDEGYKHR